MGWRVASGRAVVTRRTVEEAYEAAQLAEGELDTRRQRRDDATTTHAAALDRLKSATSALASARANAERLEASVARFTHEGETLASTTTTLESDLADVSRQIHTVDEELDGLREQLPSLEEAWRASLEREERRGEEKRELDDRRRAVDAESTVLSRREAEFAERRRLIEQRQEEIERRLEGRTGERQAAAAKRQLLEFDLEALQRLGLLVEGAAEEIRVNQEAMDSTYREQLEATRASAELLEEVRRARHEADVRLNELGEVVRRYEIEQAELVVKVANVHEVVRRDLGVEPHEMGPAPTLELPEGASLEQRVGELEARITSLGPINPLALEELAELEERYKELDAQVSDVRHARRELQEVVRALDEEIMQTFTSAFADVNEHFSSLIAMLFPGGQGRLNMSEPDDPLNTGVEIEVRPMGRNVRRISLLSGGERSMAALAFLFAVFRSRPSPFYLMDEVEAALDDVNLQRFLSLVNEFRDEAQLLIVTHQKRTMENADALYGVTMVPGASSKVVSQRVNRQGREAKESRNRGRERASRRHNRDRRDRSLSCPGRCGRLRASPRRRAPAATPPRAAMPEVLVSEPAPIPSLEEISLGDRLASSRGVFDRVRSLSGSGEVSPEQLDVVEEVLLRSDVGVATTAAALDELREHGAPDGIAEAVRVFLLDSLTGTSHDGHVRARTVVLRSGCSLASTAWARPRPLASSPSATTTRGAASCWRRGTPSAQRRPTSSSSGRRAPTQRSCERTRGPTPVRSCTTPSAERTRADSTSCSPTRRGGAPTAPTCSTSSQRFAAWPTAIRARSSRRSSCSTRPPVRTRSVKLASSSRPRMSPGSCSPSSMEPRAEASLSRLSATSVSRSSSSAWAKASTT